MTASPVILVVVIILTSLGVVYSRHQDRMLFIELQGLGYEKDAMDVEYGQLQLEQSTLTTHGKVEHAARTRLGMITPVPEQMQIIKP
ncbi:MAG: cell division protein FtsL [Pseudomonadota bacterium]